MTEEFSVTITARGEGLDYRDPDGLFRFELSHKGNKTFLHAYDCRGEAFLPRTFSDEQRQHIIPRIVSHLERHGSRVEVLSESPPVPRRPLRSVDDILQERLRRRDAEHQKTSFFKRLFSE